MGGPAVRDTIALRTLWLRFCLALRRLGQANVAIFAVSMAALAAGGWSVLQTRHVLRERQTELARMTQALTRVGTIDAPIRSSNDERLQAFYRALGEAHYAEQQIKTLFAVAAKTGLNLDQAEYRDGVDKYGQFRTYQVTLPIKGTYGAIRQFCEQVLLVIPFASLDQVDFKREAIANNVVEAKLHFTLYLAEPSSGARTRPIERETVE
jgi:hypothetical protein